MYAVDAAPGEHEAIETMADFPIKLGQRNGGNARIIRGLTSGVFKDSFCGDWWWAVNLVPTSIALEADLSQTFALNTIFSGNPFPTNVVRKQPLIYVETPVSGGAIATATAILGDTADPNGLIEAQSVFTGASGFLQSTAALEFAPRFEAAYAPELTLVTTAGNVNALTAMSLWVLIQFSPVASVT